MKAPSGLMIESALADFHACTEAGLQPARTVEHYNAEQLQMVIGNYYLPITIYHFSF